jgi:hypothetical protein
MRAHALQVSLEARLCGEQVNACAEGAGDLQPELKGLPQPHWCSWLDPEEKENAWGNGTRKVVSAEAAVTRRRT